MTGRMLLCLTVLVFAAMPSWATVNLVQNGSFETGTAPGSYLTLFGPNSSSLTGWSVNAVPGGGMGATSSLAYVGTYWQAADGSRSVGLNGTQGATLSQTLAGLTAGQQYTLSFDMAGYADGATKGMDVYFGNALQWSTSFNTAGHSLANMGWENRTFSFVAPSSSLVLRFASTTPQQSQQPGGEDDPPPPAAYGPAIDNVGVFAAPEPATLCLLGCTVGAGYLVRLRKRRSGAV